jgi:uncharacterized protein (TIGR03437 family)
LSGDGEGQGAIFHARTRDIAGSDDPAAGGESVDVYCTGLPIDRALPPQVVIGGRIAVLLAISTVLGSAGVTEVSVRVPSGIAPGPAVRVRLTYADRPSNEVTMAVR